MIKLSNGNKKIGKDTFILNITSATNCPSKALGLCKHPGKCYAMKAERLYPACFPFREAQANYWDNTPYETIALDIDQAINKKRTKIKYLRLNESGDFKSQADVKKLQCIASILKAIQPDLRIYTYTARKDLYFDDMPDNVTINGSGFMLHNEFRAVYEHSNQNMQCLGDCKICNRCKYRTGKVIEVKYH